MFSFILFNYKSWRPGFEIYSIINIIGATLCSIFALIFFKKGNRDAWKSLSKSNTMLEESKNCLQNVLDSIAEAILGVDVQGNCTFCNLSCVRMLGYSSEADLLGKNMKELMHCAHEQRAKLPYILMALEQGLEVCAQQEVLLRADGTRFYSEYSSYPQFENGQVTGAIVTFMDITERSKREAQIQYLSEHDALTGLKNRRCFEENLKKNDIPENLPLSVIFGDINSLKLTNDIFGHAAGDKLIKKCSEILVACCRKEDIITRVGGDEFVILLPKTTREATEKIITRIKEEFKNACISAIKCSISLGSDVKVSIEQDLDDILSNAENAMYKDKVLSRQSDNLDIADTLIDIFHSRFPRERQHSIAVSELCGQLGEVLNLPAAMIVKLKRAGYLHDIGKISLEERLFSNENLSEADKERLHQHTVSAYRILSLFENTLDFAEDVYSHHERWDGSGYPRGLKEDQIPLIARVITIAGTYEQIINNEAYPPAEAKEKAIARIRAGVDTQFDPYLANTFIAMVESQSA